MNNKKKIEKNLHKFIFEQKASTSHALNIANHDSNKINPATLSMRDAMASWISAVDRKELIVKLKTFLLNYPAVESLSITGSWQYARFDAGDGYAFSSNFAINFFDQDAKGLNTEDLEEELIYELDLFDNFSDYETQNIISHLSHVSLKNIDTLFSLITDEDDMKAFLAVEHYEKNQIKDTVDSAFKSADVIVKKQKI